MKRLASVQLGIFVLDAKKKEKIIRCGGSFERESISLSLGSIADDCHQRGKCHFTWNKRTSSNLYVDCADFYVPERKKLQADEIISKAIEKTRLKLFL